MLKIYLKNLATCGTDGRLRVAFKNYSWPWPWIRSYGIRSCITHRPLSTYPVSLKSEKLFCGRTNRRDRTKFKVTWHKN